MSNSTSYSNKVDVGGIVGGGGGGGDMPGNITKTYLVDGVVYDEEQWWRIQVLEKLDRTIGLLERMQMDGSG